MDIGNPVEFQGKAGWIAKLEDDSRGNVYTIGAGGMQQNKTLVSVVWDNDTTSEQLSEHIVAPWLARAYHDAKPAEEVAEMFRKAQAAEIAARNKRTAEQEEYRQRVDAWCESIRDKIPADAKAVIVAELRQDESDSMTDYFGSSTKRVVILAFSRHTRDLFPEMRKAALNFDGTAHLADGPSDFEHREKYSMGGGYYLKDGWRHRSGWMVRKHQFYGQANDPATQIPYGDWMVPDAQPFATGNPPVSEQPSTTAASVGGFTIEEHTHTKRGFQMWIVSPAERVERDTFTAWLERAKSLGGWYSRKWGSTPAGFAFKSETAAREFAANISEQAA